MHGQRANVLIFAGVTVALWSALAAVSNPHSVYEVLSAASFVTLTIPFVMVLALGTICGLLGLVLAALSVPSWVVGRPTGLGGLLGDLGALPRPIVPRYFGALLGLRSPVMRGFFLGSLVATVIVSLRVSSALAAGGA